MGAVMSNSDPPRSESSTAIPLKSLSPKSQNLRASKSVTNIRDQKDNNGFFRNSFMNAISMKKLSIGKEKNSPEQLSNLDQNEELPQPPRSILTSGTCKQKLFLEDAKNNNDYKDNKTSPKSGILVNPRHSLMKSTSCYTLINEKKSHLHNTYFPTTHHYRQSSTSPVNMHPSSHMHRKNNNHMRYSRSIDSMMSSKKYVIHASTNELLKCLGYFLFYQCPQLERFQPNSAIGWIRAIDRSLIMQGWAEIAFINPANVVFIFMMLKDFTKDESLKCDSQLQILIQTCLYISYSYMGNEISYPLAPFILEEDRDVFWSRCLDIINKKSGDMLRLNSDPVYFTEVFTELKSYAQNFS